MQKTFYAHGKLLIAGEYFVLDGALALAVPTKFGQSLEILDNEMGDLQITSLDMNEKPWFTASYSLPDLVELTSSSDKISRRFLQILKACRELNPDFLNSTDGKIALTRLEFPRNWGLGTSSTLVYTMAKWAEVDPFELLKKTFGGSGYDIACAGVEHPISYHLDANYKNGRHFGKVKFQPSFHENLYFVFLNHKQNSRDGIARYRKRVSAKDKKRISDELTGLTYRIGKAKTLESFEQCLNQHEEIVSKALAFVEVKDLYFHNYWGSVKSLGAWGGDFVLVTSNRSEAETKAYFLKKEYDVFLRFEEMVLGF